MYSDSYDTSGGCTRVSGVERMLIRKISDVEKFTKNSRRFMCRRFVGLGMHFFVLLYGVTYWEKCLCITAAIRYKR